MLFIHYICIIFISFNNRYNIVNKFKEGKLIIKVYTSTRKYFFTVCLFFLVLILILSGCSIIKKQIDVEILNTDKPVKISFEEYSGYEESVKNTDYIIKNLDSIAIRGQAYFEINEDSTYGSDIVYSDGVGIILNFYNKRGKQIYFNNIPLVAILELYVENENELDVAISDDYLGCRDYFFINRTVAANELLVNNFIRIPYNDFTKKPGENNKFGIVRLTISTPNQGKFEAIDDNARFFSSTQ